MAETGPARLSMPIHGLSAYLLNHIGGVMIILLPRKIATQRGIVRYFNGKPCINGHIAERYTKKSFCVECSREALRRHLSIESNLKAHNLRGKKWRESHKRESAFFVKQWQERNKERFKSLCSRWKSENKDKVNTYTRNRRALIRGSDGAHTADDVSRILALQDHRCAICMTSIKDRYHVDHIEPIVRGGSNGKDNLQVLCPSCNTSKGGKDPYEFAATLGRLF